jgi:hypothetical protein
MCVSGCVRVRACWRVWEVLFARPRVAGEGARQVVEGGLSDEVQILPTQGGHGPVEEGTTSGRYQPHLWPACRNESVLRTTLTYIFQLYCRTPWASFRRSDGSAWGGAN